MTDLREFSVTLKMARKTGPLHTDVEYRTFTVRTPAANADKARDAAFGLGHGINDATDHAWKFVGRLVDDGITVEPAQDPTTELEQLRAALAEKDAQLTAANRRNDGLQADERYAGRAALTEYRDANHRHNHRAPGWCICGDDWDDEGCTEYIGLTEAAQLYTGEKAGAAR